MIKNLVLISGLIIAALSQDALATKTIGSCPDMNQSLKIDDLSFSINPALTFVKATIATGYLFCEYENVSMNGKNSLEVKAQIPGNMSCVFEETGTTNCDSDKCFSYHDTKVKCQ